MRDKLIDDTATHFVNHFEVKYGSYVKVAEPGEWRVIQLTQLAALIVVDSVNAPGYSFWIPKTQLGFDPSETLYVSKWFFENKLHA